MSVDVLHEASQDSAEALLGESFFSIETVAERLDVSYSETQLRKLAMMPFTAEVLGECRRTHVLVPGYPFSVRQLLEFFQERVFCARDNALEEDQSVIGWSGRTWMNDTIDVEWHLLRKEPKSEMFGLTYNEQLKLVNENEYVPSLAKMLYLMLLTYLVSGRRLFRDAWVRCKNMDRDQRVCLGKFDAFGLGIEVEGDDVRLPVVGLALGIGPMRT